MPAAAPGRLTTSGEQGASQQFPLPGARSMLCICYLFSPPGQDVDIFSIFVDKVYRR